MVTSLCQFHYFLLVGPDNLTFTGPEGSVLAGNVASLNCASAGGMPPPNVTIAKEDGTVLASGLSPQEFDYTPVGGSAQERFLCTSKNVAGSLYDSVIIHVVGEEPNVYGI